MTGTFVHDLHAVRPRAPGEFALDFEFGELRFVVGVGDCPWTESIADAEAHVIGGHDFANIVPVRVKETFLVMRQAPFGHNTAAAADDAGHAMRRERNEAQQHAGVNGEVINALLGLLDRKSTRLNSSHTVISYAVFCLKKKNISNYVCNRIKIGV